jgi:hypothetical protein
MSPICLLVRCVVLAWLFAAPLSAQRPGTVRSGGKSQPPSLLSVPIWYFPKGHEEDKARVVLQAVIDTTGRVDPPTITVVSSTDTLFNLAAILTLLGAQYPPAYDQGEPVRVEIRQGITIGGVAPGLTRCEVDSMVTPLLPPRCLEVPGP